MLTTEQEDYLLEILPKIHKLRFHVSCCSRKRKIVYKQLMETVFKHLNIFDKIKEDPDESFSILDKHIFEECTSSIQKRHKVLAALKK